jgi:hypothetical protein
MVQPKKWNGSAIKVMYGLPQDIELYLGHGVQPAPA